MLHGMQGRRSSLLVPATVLGAALLLSSCAEGPPVDELDVSGFVTASTLAGGGPISGALVRFSSDTGLATETRTGDDGRYRMRVLTDHPFGQVSAEAEGFLPRQATVYFDRPERRVDLVLQRPDER